MKNTAKILLLLSLAALPGFSARASSPVDVPMPVVRCEAIYTESAEDGSNTEYKISQMDVTSEVVSSDIEGFRVSTHLRPIRAAGRRLMPIAGYDLHVEIAQGESVSTMDTYPKAKQRYSTALQMGNRRMHLNCDVQ